MGKEVVVLFILLLMLAAALYLLYDNLPKEPKELMAYPSQSSQIENITLSFGEGIQFYPNMRFPSKRISFKVSDNCDDSKKEDVLEALNIISTATILSFYERDNAEIDISCSEEKAMSGNLFIAGEGGPTSVVNTSLYNVILKGKVLLLKASSCDKPVIELHELLHALGFDHVDDEKNIMYPITKCEQEITAEILDIINSLYSIESLPDLYIEQASAVKKGKYLDFEIEIRNQGLIASENTSLAIVIGDEVVKSFDIGAIDIGAGKILTIQNLKIWRRFDRIGFQVDENNKIKEIYESNNIIYMVAED